MQVTELMIVKYKQVVLYYLNLFHFSWHINLMSCKKINIKYHWYKFLFLLSIFLSWTTLQQMNKLLKTLSFINLASLLKKHRKQKALVCQCLPLANYPLNYFFSAIKDLIFTYIHIMALTTTTGSAYFFLLVQNDDNNAKYKMTNDKI